MKLKITTNQKNQLLNRTEIAGVFELEGATPSNRDLILELAKGKDAELVVMKEIKTSFGGAKALFKAVIYDSLKDKNDIEQQTRHQRKQAEETAKKTAEAPAA